MRRPAGNPPRDALLSRIAEAEARLAAIDHEREEARARLRALREQLGNALPGSDLAGRPPVPAGDPVPSTPAEKVRLFRSLFRGREDVFPTRFVSRRTGKAGYAPACANKFVRGVCELPRIKCGECPNRAFIPVSDQAVLDHLQGRHVMGVYPLLQDETCRLLAVDFDKGSWVDDVVAFAETCRAAGVPPALERSRSGNGAHVWFFFTSPVAASAARRMGCFLITQTMARRHQIGMDSYDRLFPNQDTMPRAGFGNLIALPLQHEARKQGNTVFLDDVLEPYSDQWAYLASVQRVEPATVEAIATEATRRGQVVGVRLAEPAEETEAAPWTRPPSRRPKGPSLQGPLPSEVRAVLAQRLFLEKEGLPPSLLNQIKRLAAFQNSEFYKKQSLRLSTALTPRVIACAEEEPDHIAMPRGCLEDVRDLLGQHGISLSLIDRRQEGEPADWRFQGRLTPIQQQAARALLGGDTGLLVAPPGVGKTVLGAYLVAERARSTLVLVHRQPLLDQWAVQLAMFLGIEETDVGRIGGGRRKPNGRLDVAMLQSLARKGQVDDRVAGYGHVVVDECHHVPAVSFERVLSEVKARYVVGLTATPHRRDGHHPILQMQLGPVRFAVDPKSEAARRPFDQRLIVRETAFRIDPARADQGIQEIYRALSGDEARNRLIIEDVVRAVEEGRSPILLTERKDHLDSLAERLRGCARHVIVLKGGMTPKERRAIAARLAEVPDDEARLVLATGRYAGEGFDDVRLDTLFLAMPVSWRGTLVQYAGRLHRLHPKKKEVRIFDYVDRGVPVLARMFEKRLRTYRAIGYAHRETLPERAESDGQPEVEQAGEVFHLEEEV